MEITIHQSEIEQAVRQYLNSILVIADTADVGIEFVATRGEKGLTAQITVTTGSEEKIEPPKGPVKRAAKVVVPEPEEKEEESTPFDDQVEEVEEVDTTEESEGKDETPRKSLFGNLAKPKN